MSITPIAQKNTSYIPYANTVYEESDVLQKMNNQINMPGYIDTNKVIKKTLPDEFLNTKNENNKKSSFVSKFVVPVLSLTGILALVAVFKKFF